MHTFIKYTRYYVHADWLKAVSHNSVETQKIFCVHRMKVSSAMLAFQQMTTPPLTVFAILIGQIRCVVLKSIILPPQKVI